MIRVVRGTVDENAEEAAVGPRAAPRRSSSSTTTSRSRNAMDSSASEAASRVRTAMRSPRFRPTCVSSKSDAWDRILRGEADGVAAPVEDLRRTREGDGPPGAPSNLDDSEAPSRPLDAALSRAAAASSSSTRATSSFRSFFILAYGRYSVDHSGTWFSAMRRSKPTIVRDVVGSGAGGCERGGG